MVADDKINIAYLIDTISCDTAGTQKQLLETIRRLDKDRFEPCLICLWQSDWMAQNELPCLCIVLDYHGFMKWSFPGIVRYLAKVVEERQLHIVQTFFEDSIFVAFFAKIVARVPFVLLSSRRDMGLGQENQPWYHLFFALALPWVNRYFAGIIANSEQVRFYVAKREKTDIKKIIVIRNGVVIPERPSVSPALFGNNGCETVWIGFVASLTSVKRHDLLIKAVAELRHKKISHKFRVVLLGEGPERDKLASLVAELDLKHHIHFVGAVKNVVPYLYHLDIGVICSDREGLSNAILEYMACGLPVVATSVGGNIELVDEKNGICCPPGDHYALATALQRLVEDGQMRMAMGAESLKKSCKTFSWDKAMAELEGYYRSFVENSI